jgi:hypothetical protein
MRRATCLFLFCATLLGSGASALAQTVTLPDTEEATGTVTGTVNGTVEQAETVVGGATGTSGGSISGGTSGGSTSGGSTSGGSTSGSGTASGSAPVASEKCPPARKDGGSASGAGGGSGGAGASGGGGGGGGADGALLASRSGGALKAVEKNGKISSGNGAVLGATAGPNGNNDRESAPALPAMPGETEEFPFTLGLILLIVVGLGFAGVLAGVTSHLLGRPRSS